MASVNQQWKRLSGDESLWKRLYFRRWKDRKLGPRQPHVNHYFTLSALAGTLAHHAHRAHSSLTIDRARKRSTAGAAQRRWPIERGAGTQRR